MHCVRCVGYWDQGDMTLSFKELYKGWCIYLFLLRRWLKDYRMNLPKSITTKMSSWAIMSTLSAGTMILLLVAHPLWIIAAKSFQLCLTLCDPIDGSPPGPSVPGILQARTLEWVAVSFSNEWKWKVKVKSESEVAQSCPTLRNPMDCSLPGSSIHGSFQARVLEWGAIAFSLWIIKLW